MIEVRLRSRAHPDTIGQQVGKLLSERDYDILLTGPTRVLKPSGQPLCVYLPGVLADVLRDFSEIYSVLHSLRGMVTDNRGPASASERIRHAGQTRSRAAKVPSAIIGAFDPGGVYRYCRLTSWTGTHIPEYETLRPLLGAVAREFAQHVPDRYRVQAGYVARTDPAWVVPGTPFTTLTVNNTYATGVHKDAGDLEAGFSCIATLRRGDYSGGQLGFPEWRVAVDMADGDLILMDAHDWHGNRAITCRHGKTDMDAGQCPECRAERISVVAYYRSKMAGCGSPEAEVGRAHQRADMRSGR